MKRWFQALWKAKVPPTSSDWTSVDRWSYHDVWVMWSYTTESFGIFWIPKGLPWNNIFTLWSSMQSLKGLNLKTKKHLGLVKDPVKPQCVRQKFAVGKDLSFPHWDHDASSFESNTLHSSPPPGHHAASRVVWSTSDKASLPKNITTELTKKWEVPHIWGNHLWQSGKFQVPQMSELNPRSNGAESIHVTTRCSRCLLMEC